MRSLKKINADFEDVQSAKSLNQSIKNICLSQLMNELELDHNTYIVNPTETEVKQEAVELYRKISNARKFQ